MSWGDVGKSAGGQDFVKIEAGQKLKLHILSDEPHSYKTVFYDSVQRSAIITDETKDQVSNPKDIRPQHAFVVVTEDGAVKVWQMGNRVAEIIKGIYDTYGGLAEVDLVVSRQGTGKATKYQVTPVPLSIDTSVVDMDALPNLEELMAPTSAEDIEKLKAGIDPSVEYDAAKMEAEAAVEAPAEEAPAEEEVAPTSVKKPAPKPPTKMGPGAQGTPDPKAPVVREIMVLLSKSVKYKAIPARQALMKRVAPGKATVGAMDLKQLIALRNELKK